MKIGENLKKLRKRANLTQQDVSQMLGFKNHTGYAHWEGDRTSMVPSLRVFVIIPFSVVVVIGTLAKCANT